MHTQQKVKQHMALSIKDLKRIRATEPPRTLIYGPPGMGKTSLAAEWPAPVFLQTEDGTPGGIELTSFGKLSTYDEVIDAVGTLYNEEHDRQTVVLDTVDKMESMVWNKACADNNWTSIEQPGFGKGYVTVDSYWRDFIEGMNALRRDRRMNIVYVAHSSINQVDDPMTQSYSRFDIRLHKRAIGIFQDEVDVILFLNQDITIMQEGADKKRGGGDKRARADGGGNRWIYAAPRPAFVAKNRYNVPDKMLYDRGQGYATLQKHFPQQLDPEPEQEPQQDALQEPAQETTAETTEPTPTRKPKLVKQKG